MSGRADKVILVVDDNPINRDVIASFLLSKQYRIDEAVNGMEAIEKVKANSYGLILMDLLLPGLDGFETVKEMRKMGITVPIVAQSSLSFKQDRDRSAEAGCDDFLPKPIKLLDLLAIVERYMPDEHDSVTVQNANDSSSVQNDGNRPSVSGYRVLLVEENDIHADRYLASLRNLGMIAARVENGTKALEIMEREIDGYDIVVSNIFTSGVDGFGLLAMAKRQYPSVLVFLYAEEYDHDSYELAIRLGADGILPKSLLESSIARAMESALTHVRGETTWDRDARTAQQVRKSQEELNKFGFSETYDSIDIAVSTLHDAGGDTAYCRRFNLAGRYGVILIDVAGHDVTSSYMSALSLGILTSLWDITQDPMQLLDAINNELLKLKANWYHICVTSLLWDQRRQKLRIACAGNPGCILLKKNSRGEYDYIDIEGGGMCLGLFRRNDLYVSHELDFLPDERLILFSDGVSGDQIKKVLSREEELLAHESVRGFSGALLERVIREQGKADDMILVTLKAPRSHPPDSHHFMLHSDYHDVDRACEWVHAQFELRPLPRGNDYDFVNLAIRESLLNAMEHGNKMRPGSIVDISMYYEKDCLRVEISDEGRGFDLAEKLLNAGKFDTYSIGKRGLPIINAVADEIEVNGGTVSLTFREKQPRSV